MVDPISIVGLLASIIQIADALTHLSSKFRHCIHTIRYAPQEVRNFHRDLSNFSASLRWFHEISGSCLSELERSPKKKERTQHIDGVKQECKVVEEGFKKLLGRFLRSSSPIKPIPSPVDRVRWYFRKPSVVALKWSLESAKSSVELFMTLYICESLQKKIVELQKASKEVPDELLRRWNCIDKQLKQQAKTSKENCNRLIEHLEKIPYSAPTLIPGMRSVLHDTQAMEKIATRRLRKESRSIRQANPPRRHQQEWQRRDPSPGPQSAGRGPHTPPPSPPFPDGAGVVDTEPSLYYLGDRVELFSRAQSASDQPRDLASITKPSETPPITTVEPWHPRSSVEPERRNMSTISPKSPEPRIYGSIIRDDGNEIRESFGEWRPEASELLRQSTDMLPGSVDRALLSLSTPKKKDPTEHQENPTLNQSESTERQGIVRTEVELIEGGQRTSYAGSSPYKAMPPFLDEDWKGIRRRPSE